MSSCDRGQSFSQPVNFSDGTIVTQFFSYFEPIIEHQLGIKLLKGDTNVTLHFMTNRCIPHAIAQAHRLLSCVLCRCMLQCCLAYFPLRKCTESGVFVFNPDLSKRILSRTGETSNSSAGLLSAHSVDHLDGCGRPAPSLVAAPDTVDTHGETDTSFQFLLQEDPDGARETHKSVHHVDRHCLLESFPDEETMVGPDNCNSATTPNIAKAFQITSTVESTVKNRWTNVLHESKI